MNYGDLEHSGPYQPLLVAYPEEVRRLPEWALTHFDKVTESQSDPLGSVGRIVERTLGAVGTAETADYCGAITFTAPSSARRGGRRARRAWLETWLSRRRCWPGAVGPT